MSFLSFKQVPVEASKTSQAQHGSMRRAFSEWIIRNYGQGYLDEMAKQRRRKAAKTFKPMLKAAAPGKATEMPMVGIIGGGFAGLYSGLMLQSLGIEFEIFEASDRVGGRIHTWYSTDYNEGKKEASGLYGEVGGMRLPQFSPDMLPVQQLALAVNAVLHRNGMDDKMVYWRKFYYDSPVQRLRFNDMQQPITKAELGNIKGNPVNPLRFGEKQNGDLPMVWVKRATRPVKTEYMEANAPYYPADLALSIVMTPFIDMINKSFEEGFKELMKYDEYSMWGYLTTVFKLKDMGVYYDPEMGNPEDSLPFSVASYLETTNVGSGMYSVSFVEIILAAYDWGGSKDPYRPSDPNVYMLTAYQGMQNLPDACHAVLDMESGVQEADGELAQVQLGIIAGPDGTKSYSPPNLTKDAQPLPPEKGPAPVPTTYGKVPVERTKKKQRVFLNHKVLELKYNAALYDGHGGMTVRLEEQRAKGKPKTSEKEYPYVITTLPNGMYLNGNKEYNLLNDISFRKAQALRECNYMPSFKAFITFKSQFWATLGERQEEGLGAASTDRPNRQIIYPSYGYGAKKGVLQVYCWAEDARRLGALSDEERVNECLKGIGYLYPEVDVLKEFAGYAPEKTTKTWFWDQHAGGGAFALFSPGQFKNIYPTLLTPEFHGSLNFAGECCSVHHGWIVGALDSAYNAVFNILKLAGDEEKIKQLEDTWGILTAPNVEALKKQSMK
jgi:monoamine oxidase